MVCIITQTLVCWCLLSCLFLAVLAKPRVDPLGLGQLAGWVRVGANKVPHDPWLRGGMEGQKCSTGVARKAEGALGAQGAEPAGAGLCQEMTKGRKEWTRAALGR